ncbi:acyl-[acyl-carrier-protein] desaturase [Motilibacter peucedani]|uniref:Acyl-[acyl-carrier-protein] desaturase n=1 Tax=Motilibacter peucedani TaxID=598650 RepID=A0A420XTX5_9ACTN|nr:acyl-ACP desaturase [Motilibacter peucedani]RKS80109.1 acyl-[acyl-carrier-protein] desaturase [Motilibacter peucedani]
MTERRPTQLELLHELEPVVEENLERHLKVAKEWMPHQYIPWSEGRDFDGPLGGEAWDPEQSRITEVGRTALVVNLLTEDNLPSYHHEIAKVFGRDGAWGTWVHRWTAEEGRHGIAIRDYLLTTRAVDPDALERARMVHMGQGFETKQDEDMLRSVAYVSFQELATRISHRNTGRFTDDPMCEALLARISTDENLHMVFYRNLLAASFQLSPNETMRAVTEVVKTFEMPGSTIDDFGRKSLQIALAGIYDLRIHHDDVISPVLRAWGVWDMEGLDADGEAAREELAEFMAKTDATATRFEEKRDKLRARMAATGQQPDSRAAQ